MSVEQQVDALATSVDELTGAVVTKTATLDASVVDARSATAQAQDARTNALSARDEAGAFKEAAYTAAQSAASAVAYQDLTALAETKAITAVDLFIYDTAKDSDGGAWRHRCAGTSWYREPLNTATRGGRREFPAVAVIVAEADKVTIYDGDDPALPMWIVLQGSYFGVPHRQGGYDYNAVAMVNGMMAYTGSNQGLLTLDFIRETSRSFHASTTRGGEYATPIAQRGVASRFPPPGQSGFTLPSSSGNDLAMTVLASAPVDPATALPVPTIAVATEGGVSVIKDDGTVANTPSSKGASCVVFFGENHVYTSERSPYNLKQRAILAPEYSSTVAVSATIRGGIHFQGPNMAHGIASPLGAANGIAVGGFNTIGGSVKGAKLWRFGLSQSYAPETMGAFLTATYNTGWMPGDIKCAFLSDADDTDLVPVVADEDFSSSTGWTLTANTSISGEQLTIDTTIDGVWYSNATKALDQPTEAGEVYY